jgi:hypothetical protein
MDTKDVMAINSIAARFAATAPNGRIGFAAQVIAMLARVDAEAVQDAMKRATAVNPAAGTLYDWRYAPGWATHAATDKSDQAYWYSEEPVTTQGYDEWHTLTDFRSERVNPAHILRRVDWRESLEARPNG